MNRLLKISLLIIMCFSLSWEAFSQDKRGITMKQFLPKGQWIVGSTLSYSKSEQENYNFVVIESATGNNHSFKISPILAYSIKENLAVGGRFAYSRDFVKLENLDIEAGEDINFDINNIYSLSQEYSAVAIMRNYISIGDSKRFALYAESQLAFTGGQSKFVDNNKNNLTGTYSTNFSTALGVVPGLVAFINNYTAVELSIGMIGVKYSHKKQVTDQIYFSNQSASSLNFNINIFSIGLGIAFYI